MSILLFVSQSLCLSICLHVYPSICLPIFLSFYLSPCLSFYLSLNLSVFLSVSMSILLFLQICLCFYLSPCLSFYFSQSVCLSICLHVYPSISPNLSVFLSVSMSLSDSGSCQPHPETAQDCNVSFILFSSIFHSLCYIRNFDYTKRQVLISDTILTSALSTLYVIQWQICSVRLNLDFSGKYAASCN